MKQGSLRLAATMAALLALVLPATLPAANWRGANLIVTRQDGGGPGELIAVKPETLVLLAVDAKVESVPLAEIKSIKIVRRPKVWQGAPGRLCGRSGRRSHLGRHQRPRGMGGGRGVFPRGMGGRRPGQPPRSRGGNGSRFERRDRPRRPARAGIEPGPWPSSTVWPVSPKLMLADRGPPRQGRPEQDPPSRAMSGHASD